jgi:aminoglycoside phosphotransferase
VYLVSVDGEHYAVKMYHKRFNGTGAGLREKNNILRARKTIPDAVPDVIAFSKHTENDFGREILVMERVTGVPLHRESFGQLVFDELTNVLKRLHNSEIRNPQEANEMERIDNCREAAMGFLNENEVLAKERVARHIDQLEQYYLREKDAFEYKAQVIHGDLWWDNILVDDGKTKLVDWLESSEQDYCRDLAQLKIGTLDEVLDAPASQSCFQEILNTYRVEFEDTSIYERMRYYLSLMYLEESFYLPFEFFPWEIMYQENAEAFEKRFVDYFTESEQSFRADSELVGRKRVKSE